MKKVMVRAWEIAREAVKKFGGKVKEFFQQALIMAWEEVKTMNSEHIVIKSWFLAKNFTEGERYAISVSDLAIEKETEKAVFIRATSDYGFIKFWCPKSCITTIEEKIALLEEENRKYEEKIHKYGKLIIWCKENNVKGVRNKMRVETIKAKIKKAGLEIPQF